jgi:tRNA 2-thiouridine synthesizing protein B
MNIHKSTLHTLNSSAKEQAALLQRLLRCASSGDSLLLIENGVYNITDNAFLTAISQAGLTLYCLQADLLARGLKQYEDGVRVVDDNAFVALSCSHQKVISWFV